MSVKITYFAHDLSDPAVKRRVRMLTAGGAEVRLIGFRRSQEPPAFVEQLRATDLGFTADGRLVRRALSISRALATLRRHADHIRGADVVLARNLEMLVLASRARKLYAPAATLVYECLDIHRTLLSTGVGGRLLRSFQSRLWQEVDLLVTSSPGFIRNYFTPHRFPAPIRLVENKVALLDSDEQAAVNIVRPPPGPPWRIGWFGAIRCRKSLEILGALANGGGGAIEIVLRGRPSGAVFPTFSAEIANLPHVRFAGPYRNPGDLPTIYSEVHFAWAVDYYESGQNSTWLLPNRIYEAGLCGAVPIALRGVETGRWLLQRGVGIVFDEPLERQLVTFFQRLDPLGYAQLANGILALPRRDLIADQNDCRLFVDALRPGNAGASPGKPPTPANGERVGV
jgi:succinoglycan biosynthesis protein ExoL